MTDETNLPVSELSANDVVYDIVGKSVVDQNNTTNLKMWSGTKAEYEALETIDETTMYLIKDDVEPLNSQTLFDCKWLDYAVDSLCWKNANDFAWISGDIYKDAYEHLVEDAEGAVESDTIGIYTVYYHLSEDGHKVCGPDQEETIQNIYNSSGIAWYYILDEVNHRFKLPRTKFAFTGYRDGVGNYVPESLPDHMHYVSRSADISNEAVTVEDGGSHDTVSRNSNLNTSYLAPSTYASYNNSTYQNDAPVQQRSTQMYLYFFVGNLIVNQYEINANGFATKHLDNLSSIGKNIANWSFNVTNCITEISQDIKIELNSGVLTLKAGSKVYVPNGFETDGTTPHFDVVAIESDITYPLYHVTTDKRFASVKTLNTTELTGWTHPNTYSGTTEPSDGSVWYDTASNLIKVRSSSSNMWETNGYSLPICIGKYTNSTGFDSIEQVFNGFGYFGSTVFALPGVKGLIPNGRNADGTLKNTSIALTSVRTRTYTTETASDVWFNLQSSLIGGLTGGFYDEQNNYLIKKSTGVRQPGFVFAAADLESGKITNWKVKTAFHALDWNDKGTIAGWSMPSNKYIDLTLGASGDTYTAPANGYYLMEKGTTGYQFMVIINLTNGLKDYAIEDSGQSPSIYLPVKKGDIVLINYNTSGTTNTFRFIYAEGEL